MKPGYKTRSMPRAESAFYPVDNGGDTVCVTGEAGDRISLFFFFFLLRKINLAAQCITH